MPKTPPAPVLCRHCFCEPTVHEHYRAGSDCGRCGKEVCPGYKPLLTPEQKDLRKAVLLDVALVAFLFLGFWGLAAEGFLGGVATVVGIPGLLLTGEFARD